MTNKQISNSSTEELKQELENIKTIEKFTFLSKDEIQIVIDNTTRIKDELERRKLTKKINEEKQNLPQITGNEPASQLTIRQEFAVRLLAGIAMKESDVRKAIKAIKTAKAAIYSTDLLIAELNATQK